RRDAAKRHRLRHGPCAAGPNGPRRLSARSLSRDLDPDFYLPGWGRRAGNQNVVSTSAAVRLLIIGSQPTLVLAHGPTGNRHLRHASSVLLSAGAHGPAALPPSGRDPVFGPVRP